MKPLSENELLIIMNPNAGLLNTEHKLPEVEELIGRKLPDAPVIKTQSEEHAAKVILSAARRKTPPRILFVGGDGTLHHAAKILAGTRVELAFVPIGSANNIARSLRIPTEPEAAISLARRGAPRPIDIGRCGRGVFIEAAGIGFHAAALLRYKMKDRKSLVRAIYSFARTTSELKPLPVELTVGGRTLRRKIYQMTISNLPLYGTNFRLAPGARPDDGLLDVTIIPPVKPSDIIPLILAARAGLLHLLPNIEHFKCRKIAVKAWTPSALHIDAASSSFSTVTFECRPAALRIIRP